MGEVFVHGPGFRFGGGYGDFHLGGVVEEVVAAFEGFVEFGNTPGRDDLDGGLEGVEGEFEADLVVTFAGAAVADKGAFLLLSNRDLATSNDWTCEGGSQEVDILVDLTANLAMG
jgi:hypothetical protein